MHDLSMYLEVSHAVGGGRGEGHLLSSPAGEDDLQPLHHAPTRRHGVVLIVPSQEDGAAPVPGKSKHGKSKVAEVKWQKWNWYRKDLRSACLCMSAAEVRPLLFRSKHCLLLSCFATLDGAWGVLHKAIGVRKALG